MPLQGLGRKIHKNANRLIICIIYLVPCFLTLKFEKWNSVYKHSMTKLLTKTKHNKTLPKIYPNKMFWWCTLYAITEYSTIHWNCRVCKAKDTESLLKVWFTYTYSAISVHTLCNSGTGELWDVYYEKVWRTFITQILELNIDKMLTSVVQVPRCMLPVNW